MMLNCHIKDLGRVGQTWGTCCYQLTLYEPCLIHSNGIGIVITGCRSNEATEMKMTYVHLLSHALAPPCRLLDGGDSQPATGRGGGAQRNRDGNRRNTRNTRGDEDDDYYSDDIQEEGQEPQDLEGEVHELWTRRVAVRAEYGELRANCRTLGRLLARLRGSRGRLMDVAERQVPAAAPRRVKRSAPNLPLLREVLGALSGLAAAPDSANKDADMEQLDLTAQVGGQGVVGCWVKGRVVGQGGAGCTARPCGCSAIGQQGCRHGAAGLDSIAGDQQLWTPPAHPSSPALPSLSPPDVPVTPPSTCHRLPPPSPSLHILHPLSSQSPPDVLSPLPLPVSPCPSPPPDDPAHVWWQCTWWQSTAL